MLPSGLNRNAMTTALTTLLLFALATNQGEAAVRQSLHADDPTRDVKCWPHGESVFSNRRIAPEETIQIPSPTGIPVNTKPSDKSV